MNQKTSISKIEEMLSFPSDGDIVSGVKVSSAKLKVKDGKMSYRICLPRGTRRADVPNILRAFYTTGLITVDGLDHVVQDHTHRIKPTRTQTIVTGSAPHGAEELGPFSRQGARPREAPLTAVACIVHNYPIDDLRVAGFRVQHDVRIIMIRVGTYNERPPAHFYPKRRAVPRHADEVVFISFLDANIRSPGARRS